MTITCRFTAVPKALSRTYRLTTQGVEHRCAKCTLWLAANTDMFIHARKSRTGLGSVCLSCNARVASDWRRNNIVKARATRARRVSRDKQAAGVFTALDKAALFAAYGHKCICCTRHTSICGPLVADHVVPVAVGGSHDAANRQPLCGECNFRKGAGDKDYRLAYARRAA